MKTTEQSRQLDALLRLSMTPGLGPILISRLLSYFDNDATQVCAATADEIAQIRGISLQRARQILDSIKHFDISEELDAAAELDAQLVPMTSAHYPALLKFIPDPPPILYVRGNLDCMTSTAISIVGSRRCSLYGREQSSRFASQLADAGFSIVSGGARGIDTAAHEGALRARGQTAVVLGCGLCHTYPRENHALFDRVVASGGAIVSEFSMRTPPAAENFPRRNRIISGLTLGTLLIEASERSGALITARLACEDHGREVMAVPGRIDSPHSAGCLRIIREGWANLVRNINDVIEALEGMEHLANATPPSPKSSSTMISHQPADLFTEEANVASDRTQKTRERAECSTKEKPGAVLQTMLEHLNDSQRQIFDAIGNEPMDIGELSSLTSVGIGQLQSDLMILQIRGLIDRAGASSVQRKRI